jgi:hypothetical protein
MAKITFDARKVQKLLSENATGSADDDSVKFPTESTNFSFCSCNLTDFKKPTEILFYKGLDPVTLDMSRNQLSGLPDNFWHFFFLKTLDLSSNAFKEFPTVLCELMELDTLKFQIIN